MENACACAFPEARLSCASWELEGKNWDGNPARLPSPAALGSRHIAAGPNSAQVGTQLPKDQLDCPTMPGAWRRRQGRREGRSGGRGPQNREGIAPGQHGWSLVSSGLPETSASSKTELINSHLLLSHSHPLIVSHTHSFPFSS